MLGVNATAARITSRVLERADLQGDVVAVDSREHVETSRDLFEPGNARKKGDLTAGFGAVGGFGVRGFT